MRHSLPSCHLPLIQRIYWTCCALLPPIHKLFIVNANSVASNLGFVLVVLEQECFELVLSLDNSYNEITIQICNCSSSCLMVCRFPERQILTPLLTNPFFSSPSPLSLTLATWSHHLPCTIFFAHQNLPPFLSAQSPSTKSSPFSCISFLPGWHTESVLRGAWGGSVCMTGARSACLGAGERRGGRRMEVGLALSGGCGLAEWLADPIMLKKLKTWRHFIGSSNWLNRLFTFLWGCSNSLVNSASLTHIINPSNHSFYY